MANIKNFGLVGVGSELQFSKGGAKLINNAGTFNFKAANGTTDSSITAASLSASGNVTLTSDNGKIAINGLDVLQKSATGNAQISGTSGLVLPAGTTAQRGTGESGLIRINTDAAISNTVEFWDGDAWVTLASGGSTGVLQTEIDNIETSLGSGISADGTFNGAGFTGAGLGSVTSFTDAINTVANAAAAKDTLDEIFAPGVAGNVIYSDGVNWQQALPGAISGVQGYDAGLQALATRTGTGILVQTGDNTYQSRSLVQPSKGITITDADGILGNPTFALADDLAGLEGLADTGYSVRTGDGTWTTRSIAGTAGRVVVTNGDGVTSNTDIDLATVTQGTTGDFLKFTVDSYGRVTGNTAVVTADITALADSEYLRLDGTSSMAGDLLMGSNKITGLAEPTASQDAATKNYVDNAVTGLSWKQAVHSLSDTNIDITNPGTATIGGHTLNAGDRVLLTGQTNAYEDGIYIFDTSTTPLVRSADADAFNELNGAAVFVQQGTYADSGWTQTTTLTSLTSGAVQVWTQFSGAGSYTGGTGIDITGNVISARLGAGITDLPSGEIGVDVQSGVAVQLTGTATGDQLTLVLDGAGITSGLSQSGTGLKIAAGGVTNAMLVNSAITLNADSGTQDPLSLGETLLVAGTSTQGISTAVSNNTITITAADASSSQKGVATFNTASFDVTAGDVTIKSAGVSNAQLANSSITFAGNTGSDSVALGETLTVSSADSAITVTAGANSLSLQLNTVDVAHGGTGLTSLTAGQLLVGNGTSAVALSSALSFDSVTNTLTVGTATIQGGTTDVTITATGTNGDINLVPNGTGSVVIGSAGAGVVEAEAGQSMTVVGNNTLVLQSTAGDIVLTLANNTTDKVSVAGPSAVDYATGLANADLVNKYYVDQAISSGAATAASGTVKVVKATVTTSVAGTYNIGAALPAGASILSVKVNVTGADSGTGTLEVGKSGSTSAYMGIAENDTQSVGIYLAETYVVEASSVQVIATVGGTVGTGGSAVVIVEYQLA